jgi:hypothetical protein
MQLLVTRMHLLEDIEKKFVLHLGGVDELSISAGVTATEYKSLFGRVAATS